MRVHRSSYTLTNKNFSFSRKPTIGCLSELLENCVGVFWYEGHMVNYKICLFGAQFASVCVNSRDREGAGMVVKMAMFASRPIIITKYTGSIGDVRSIGLIGVQVAVEREGWMILAILS